MIRRQVQVHCPSTECKLADNNAARLLAQCLNNFPQSAVLSDVSKLIDCPDPILVSLSLCCLHFTQSVLKSVHLVYRGTAAVSLS